MRELPPRARAFVVTVILAAMGAVALTLRLGVSNWASVLQLGLLFAAACAFSVDTSSGVAYSPAYIVSLAAVAALGLHGAVIVGVFGVFLTSRQAKMNVVKRAFNGAQFALAALVAALVFTAISAPIRSGVPAWLYILAAALAAVVYALVNTSLVALAVGFASGLAPRRVFDTRLAPLVATQLGYALLAVLFAEIYVDYGPVSAVFVLAPLVIARQAFANYAQLRGAYESTLRALVQAVETKDFYTRGHSERVGRAAQMIAREYGLREDKVQVIHYAGMLHDVGKLGVPTRVLQKQGKLNDEEFEAIKLHPLRGYEMLAEIEFLTEALSGVYHHHERMDGRGYPMGLLAEEIPEIARIIMVADAFDSMTSTRSYRQAKTVGEAIAELHKCQDVQFDAHVVECLVSAIGKHGWEAHAEDFHGEQVGKDGQPIPRPDDHDPDPELHELRLLMADGHGEA